MKNIQAHVYLPEDHMNAIRAAAKEELRTPQNFLSYLLQTSQNYQQIVWTYAEATAPTKSKAVKKTRNR